MTAPRVLMVVNTPLQRDFLLETARPNVRIETYGVALFGLEFDEIHFMSPRTRAEEKQLREHLPRKLAAGGTIKRI